MLDVIESEFSEHWHVLQKTMDILPTDVAAAAQMMIDALTKGNKVILFGNGGSAGDAQHIAAELVCKYVTERRALPAIALTTDSSAMTAISNDFGYETVFARQVEALAVEGDLLIGISTSGTSANVLRGLEQGKQAGCKLIGLSGNSGGAMNDLCDLNIIVPSNITARIQEMHILIGHTLCQLMDQQFS
jgi:D-sedoheptulose 7-phosphate isomerase